MANKQRGQRRQRRLTVKLLFLLYFKGTYSLFYFHSDENHVNRRDSDYSTAGSCARTETGTTFAKSIVTQFVLQLARLYFLIVSAVRCNLSTCLWVRWSPQFVFTSNYCRCFNLHSLSYSNIRNVGSLLR